MLRRRPEEVLEKADLPLAPEEPSDGLNWGVVQRLVGVSCVQ